MGCFESIALASNAPGYPSLKALCALTVGFRLEVVGAAVSAAGRTPLEETTSGEFVTGRNHIFCHQIGYRQQSRPSVFRDPEFFAGLPWR